MPTYQYQCRDCGNGFEQFQKFSEDALSICPSCDGTVQRVIQNVGVVFKGSGWYITDSRKPSSTASTSSDDAPSAKSTAADGGAAKPDSDSAKSKEPAANGSKSPKSAEPAATPG